MSCSIHCLKGLGTYHIVKSWLMQIYYFLCFYFVSKVFYPFLHLMFIPSTFYLTCTNPPTVTPFYDYIVLVKIIISYIWCMYFSFFFSKCCAVCFSSGNIFGSEVYWSRIISESVYLCISNIIYYIAYEFHHLVVIHNQ